MIFDGMLESSVDDPSILNGILVEEEAKKPEMTDEEEKKAVEEAFNILTEALAPPRFGRDLTPKEISDNVAYKLKAIKSPYAKDFSEPERTPGTNDAAPLSGFKRLLQNTINLVSKKNKVANVGYRYQYVLSIQREIVDIYREINRLFKNDNALYTYFAQNTVTTVSYNGLQIKDKVSNDIYEYSIIPNEIPIVDILTGIVNLSKSGRHNEYAQLKRFSADVFDWLRKYYWFTIDCSPEASLGASAKMTLADHLYTLREYTNNIYASIYALTEYMSQNTQYLLLVQKNYAEVERKIGDDKEAMKIADEIYTEVLRYSQAIIDFNFTAHEVLHEFMNKYYNEIKELYAKIKQQTGYLK